MMNEAQYPGFQKVYRLLRKEKVEFPIRDPNVRMFMSSLGLDSPMFDYIEQISGRPTATPAGKIDKKQKEK